MGWATYLFCNITFNRETYKSKYEVMSDLEDAKKAVQQSKQRLYALAVMTEPYKVLVCETEDSVEPALDAVNREYNDAMEDLEENLFKQFKLEYLEENWDTCHTKKGLAIPPPKKMRWDAAYLDGDFIPVVERKNKKSDE